MSDATLDRCREILADGPRVGFTHDGFTVIQTAILEASADRILPVGVAVIQADEGIGCLGWALPFAEWGEAARRNLGLDPWIPDAGQSWPDYERPLPGPLSHWRHYKGGEYRVVAVAFEPPSHTDPLVIYQPIGDPSIRWARPLSSWNQVVDVGGAIRGATRRFMPVPVPTPGTAPAEPGPTPPAVIPPFPEEPPAQWAVCELMGHVKMAGRLTEADRFGGRLARLDVPQPDGSFATTWFAAQSVYRVTEVTEATARGVARASWPRPVKPYESRSLASPAFGDDDRDFDEDDPDRGF